MKWYIAIAHRRPTSQALDTLENKLVDFSALTAGLDMSRFHLMDFGTRLLFFSRSTRNHRENVCTRNPGSWAPATTIGASAFLMLMGTQAHEWFQAHQQSAGFSQQPASCTCCLVEEYPDQLGIALTDCITMDAFLRDFGVEFASRYQGLRHDSGDPVEWGEKAIAHYEKSWELITE